MSVRRHVAIAWMTGAFALMLACWATYSGPYRWAADWQLKQFGSYELKLTLFGPLIILLIPAGFIGGWGPLAPRAVTAPAVRMTNARRNARIIASLGAAVLAMGAAGGALGTLKTQAPLRQAELRLVNGREAAPDTDLVTVIGIARPDLIVGYEETGAGSTSRWSFMPLVSLTWRPGKSIRFLLKTNQTAWLPPAGMGVSPMPGMLVSGNPPFSMTTQPSVLKPHALPGVVRAEYVKARIPLDPTVFVIEQSADEILAPHWMIAAGGGLVGVCLLVVGLIGVINAGKAARP